MKKIQILFLVLFVLSCKTSPKKENNNISEMKDEDSCKYHVEILKDTSRKFMQMSELEVIDVKDFNMNTVTKQLSYRNINDEYSKYFVDFVLDSNEDSNNFEPKIEIKYLLKDSLFYVRFPNESNICLNCDQYSGFFSDSLRQVQYILPSYMDFGYTIISQEQLWAKIDSTLSLEYTNIDNSNKYLDYIAVNISFKPTSAWIISWSKEMSRIKSSIIEKICQMKCSDREKQHRIEYLLLLSLEIVYKKEHFPI